MSAPAGEGRSTPGDGSASLVRAWVATYTRGLPDSAAAERKALIEADLWDEASVEGPEAPSGLARQRLSRLVRGLPADIAWRVEQQRRTTKGPVRTAMRIPLGQLIAIGVVAILQIVMIVGLLASTSFREWDGMGLSILGLGIGLVALAMAIRRPRAGFLVGVIGSLILLLVMPWLLPFFVPLPIVLGYRLAREPTVNRTTTAGA
jgi:hypothetical protein